MTLNQKLNFRLNLQNSAEIFPAMTGGAMKMANDFNVDFLGALPLDPLLARCCDEGKNFLIEMPDSPTVIALNTIVQSKLLCHF